MRSSIRPGTLIILLILCAVIVWQRRTIQNLRQLPEATESTQSTTGPQAPSIVPQTTPKPNRKDPPSENDQALRERIVELESQLAELTKPLEADIRSATVDTEVLADETLVTGGYKTPDGNTNFLFLRPERVTLDDGREAVKLASTVLALSEEHLKGSAVEDLATNASNTLQHGEAWQNTEAESVLKDLRETGMAGMPSVITLPGQAAQITIQDGLQYKVTPEILDNGRDFRVRLRMENPIKATYPIE
jgi:hypothetical protein